MNFELPTDKGYTIYSKPNCINCTKVKKLLKDNKLEFKEIMCDEYILESKEEFLEFIKNLTKEECKFFPIIFLNGDFIGGYDETLLNIQKMLLNFEDL
jgi:glutaredoxin